MRIAEIPATLNDTHEILWKTLLFASEIDRLRVGTPRAASL
jgi:hypothetical protein